MSEDLEKANLRDALERMERAVNESVSGQRTVSIGEWLRLLVVAQQALRAPLDTSE